MLNKNYILLSGAFIVVCGLSLFFWLNQENTDTAAMKLASSTDEQDSTSEQLSIILREIKHSNAQLGSKIELNQKQIASLSHRLDELQTKAENEEHPPEDEIEAFDENTVSPIQREKELFNAEFVDFNWSPKAEADLESGLNSMGEEVGFSLVNATCKTTRCMATVSFSSYQEATRNASHLVENVIPGLNCSQTVSIPEPHNKTSNYETELLLDCSQQVAGKVEPL